MSKTDRIINFDYNSPLNIEPSAYGTPERNLLMSMLERAILDYVGNDTRDVDQATEWIFGSDLESSDTNEDSLTPFSFIWTCRELDLDPKFVSTTIKAMPRRGKNRVAPWYFTKY
jgi:hypothetical protein